MIVLSFFEKFSLTSEEEEKHSYSEIIDDFRKIQEHSNSKRAKISLKPFISKISSLNFPSTFLKFQSLCFCSEVNGLENKFIL